MEWLGWAGSVALAVCAIPQAYKSWKDGHSNGITWGLLSLWFIGEILTLLYILPKGHIPLILNYAGNIIFVGFIMRYKLWPRKRK